MGGTFQLHRPDQSHREFGYRAGENNFVKWKGTFRSDRQVRSVSIKGSHSQGALACVAGGISCGQTFYLGKHDLLTVYLGKLDFLSVTDFSPGNLPRENLIVWASAYGKNFVGGAEHNLPE